MTDPRLKHGDQIPLLKIMPPSEKEEERMCIDLYEQCGLVIIKFSQPHKATQTRGIADLLVLAPKMRLCFFHEVKRREGPDYKKIKSDQSTHQRWFQLAMESVGLMYIIGPLSTAKEKLVELGILR